MMNAQATTNCSMAQNAHDDSTTAPARLLESDPCKYRSVKQVIVLGSPGSGTDGMSDALKTLGFKVYDFQAASSRCERDFPLWVEAARLRNEGRPYSKDDFDKVIGNHDALVGAPVCFFGQDLVKLYPNVKIILVTRETSNTAVARFLKKIMAPIWRRIDPLYYGSIFDFLTLNSPTKSAGCGEIDEKAIREAVKERSFLKIHDQVEWEPLCKFLATKVPEGPAPELHDNVTEAELAARPWRFASSVVCRAVKALSCTSTIALVILVAAIAVVFGIYASLRTSSIALRIFRLLISQAQACNVTLLSSLGAALTTLVGGFVAGYALGSIRSSETFEATSPTSKHQRSHQGGHRRNKAVRGKQSSSYENRRPERETLSGWESAQDNIRKDDVEMSKEGKTSFEEWKKNNRVTLNVTHKLTERGHHALNGPRKVVSVSAETIG